MIWYWNLQTCDTPLPTKLGETGLTFKLRLPQFCIFQIVEVSGSPVLGTLMTSPPPLLPPPSLSSSPLFSPLSGTLNGRRGSTLPGNILSPLHILTPLKDWVMGGGGAVTESRAPRRNYKQVQKDYCTWYLLTYFSNLIDMATSLVNVELWFSGYWLRTNNTGMSRTQEPGRNENLWAPS